MSPGTDGWPQNYFNYFTEVEEHFQKARGTGLFLLSPLDWALIESWRSSGVPLEAVLRGIDIAFEKWRKKRVRTQMVNSLAFCSQAVLKEAEVLANAGTQRPKQPAEPPFPKEEIQTYLTTNATTLRSAGFEETAASLEQLAANLDPFMTDLEQLEQRLSAMEEKLLAQLKAAQSDDALLEMRKDLDQQLKAYRGKMSGPQIAMLEKQYFERKLLEQSGLPRLSLYYLK